MAGEIEINLESLRKRKVFIATPMYGGMATAGFLTSLMQLQHMRDEMGLPFVFQAMTNESLVPRARNTLAARFLSTDCTELMFIDADIEFDAQDVILLQHFDKELIGGAYPKKSINWEQVKKAALKNPDIDPRMLALAGQSWASHLFKGEWTVSGAPVPIEAKELATGFMLIKREVFEQIAEASPEFAPSHEEPDQSPRRDYFSVGVKDGWYESEDYSFCRKWREAGGTVWLCPWMKLNHQGFYNFPGGFLEGAAATGELI